MNQPKSPSPPNPPHPEDDLFQAYLDGELEGERQLEVEQHLTGCPGCRHKKEEFAALFTRLETLPDLPLGKDLSGEIQAVLQTRSELSRRMTLTAVLQLAAAAVVLILSVPLLEKTYLFGQLEGLNRTLIAGTRVYLTSLLGEWSTFWQGSHTLFKNTPFPDLLLPLADTNSLLPWSLIGFGLLAALLINHLMLSGVNQNSPSSPHH